MIAQNARRLLDELPPGVQLVAAVKKRTAQEILEAVNAGVRILGESHVQQAERDRPLVGSTVEWHLIGHLQSNKVKKAVQLFDMIQTVDSLRIADEISRRCAECHKLMPVLIEVNVGRESQKTGVLPEDAPALVRQVARLPGIAVAGLMTMGQAGAGEPVVRVQFREVKQLFDSLGSAGIPGVKMQRLSMGMSDSYRVAIEEGATMVRVGRLLFEGFD